MRPGEHEWPEEFQDEDKWLRLTKRQWLILGIGVLLGGLVVLPFITLGLVFLLPIALVLAFILLVLSGIVAFMVVPDRYYLFGSGMKIEKVLLRLFLKKRKQNKIIYTKHYDNYRQDRGVK